LTTIRVPASATVAEHRLELAQEGRGVAAGGILGPGAKQDEHGELGEVVTGNDITGPSLSTSDSALPRSP
jgi:hypothetical protein